MKVENNNRVKKSFRIESEILEQIEIIMDNSNFTFSEFINSALFHFLENQKNKNFKVKEFIFENQREKNIRVSFSKNEYEVLSNLAIKNGFNSVSKEVKFITLNAIYKDENFFNNIEMKELKNGIGNLNKLGQNLNALLKILQENDRQNLSFNYNKFMPFLQSITNNINEIKELVFYYQTFLKSKALNG